MRLSGGLLHLFFQLRKHRGLPVGSFGLCDFCYIRKILSGNRHIPLIHIQGCVQLCESGALFPKHLFLREGLSGFFLCRRLLLIQIIQCILYFLHPVRHCGKAVIQAGDISPGIRPQGSPVTHAALQDDFEILPEAVIGEFHGKAPVTADRNGCITAFVFFAGGKDRLARCFFVCKLPAFHLHPDKILFWQWMCFHGFQIPLEPCYIPLVPFNLCREIFQQLILQPVLLALVVCF